MICSARYVVKYRSSKSDPYIQERLRITLKDAKQLRDELKENSSIEYLGIYLDGIKQQEFTDEQRDFICYQIGEWYLYWRDHMWVDGKPNQHWLGRGKEQLKNMICGADDA